MLGEIAMTKSIRALIAVAALAAVISLATHIVTTQLRKDAAQKEIENIVRDYFEKNPGETQGVVKDYLAHHPEDVQRIVKDYLVKNPEVVQEVLAELFKRRQPSIARNNFGADKSAEIRSNEKLLFASPRQVTLGNPDGDVTIVEFFDYNCGFCKRALADTMTLIKDDPKLRIVLKEFPILGPGSAEAARVGVAVHMQDPGGQKYLDFHQKLLGAQGQANKDSALAAAMSAGLDMIRLESDMASDEVSQTLAENVKLARILGINGTPGYVVGDTIVPGAVGASALKVKIQVARDRTAK
jgi:protein-disulfide isomerase